ncbi:hypothetical protein [Marinomonas posidonica]|uniref:hypothetical protein n=1 Tax=Marinomonas posidonica TaxID=936476 RepID=UPI003735BEDA
MTKLHKSFAFVLTFVLAGLATSANAIENRKTLCVHGNENRVIEVVYPEGNRLPCEVQYTKAGNTKTLWNAKNKAGYCENKAAEFVEKQIAWGWSCDLVEDMKEELTAQ